MATPTVPTSLEISSPFSSFEQHQFFTNLPIQPQSFNQHFGTKNFGNNSWTTTNVDEEQQLRDSEYRFGMVENGVVREGEDVGRGGNEVIKFF
jgi:hypothetical protein